MEHWKVTRLCWCLAEAGAETGAVAPGGGDGDVVMKTVNGDITDGGNDGGGSTASREEDMEEGTIMYYL